MAYYDIMYTCGVIATREKRLLKDKIFRFCELSGEEAFRLLVDSGYGGGASVASNVYEYENLISAEENALDDFIREYAPSRAEKSYLLSPRDFHNAKALVKAKYLGRSAEGMLAPEGLIPVSVLSSAVEAGDFTQIKPENEALAQAMDEATAYLSEGSSGAKLGDIFEKALYKHLKKVSAHKPVLKKLLTAKADMTNILTALRTGDGELAKDKYLPAGKLSENKLSCLFLEDKAKAVKSFKDTPYFAFVEKCFDALEKGEPMTQAEKALESFDVDYFAERKYDLSKTEPFLYYVYRRRNENANVRIVFVCLLAGLKEADVKKRLRTL